YQVKAQVAAVAPSSDAERQGLQAEDFVLSWNYQRPSRKAGQGEKWLDTPISLRADETLGGDPDPRWASVFTRMPGIEYPRVRLQVRHKDGAEATVEVDLTADETWPLFNPSEPRGVPLFPMQDRIIVADGLGDAVRMGMRYTYRTIATIYMSLKALVTQ